MNQVKFYFSNIPQGQRNLGGVEAPSVNEVPDCLGSLTCLVWALHLSELSVC